MDISSGNPAVNPNQHFTACPTMQKELRPNQAAVANGREEKSSGHTQDTLTSIPAQHYGRQQERGC